MTVTLYLGRWQEFVSQLGTVQAIITDPPYGARTHKGHNAGQAQCLSVTGQQVMQSLDYQAFTPDLVAELVGALAPFNTGWWACQTSHDLIDAYTRAYELAGLYAFAPVPVEQFRPRLLGDGPSSFGQYLMVGRPKTRQYQRWRSLPAIYRSHTVSVPGITGTKPESLMREIIRDYSHPGDTVLDPFAGSGTTLTAARSIGRKAIGVECDPAHYQIALDRLQIPYTVDIETQLTKPDQGVLL